MKKTWIHEQTEYNVLQWDNALEANYPDSTRWLRDPHVYHSRLCLECNYLEAVKRIDWQADLGKDAKVLDLGCGGGWLTGYLSAFDAVGTLYALDSSRRFLTELLPPVVERMGGRLEKIEPIEAMFTPLLFPDGALDAVVASSALHHAPSLEEALREVRRVLKTGGVLYILNESPRSWLRYVAWLCLAFVRIMRKVVTREYATMSPAISAAGFLYDPCLGDRSYPLWYWREAIRRAGFAIVEVMDTGLPTIKGMPGASLTHLICRAV